MSADELIDVLDAQGEKTGQVLNKDQVHGQGLWHAGAHVWIYNSRGEVLLQLRAAHKLIYPDVWDISAAGHLSAGDAPTAAALRETEEELGLRLQLTELEFVGTIRTVQLIPGAGFTHHVYDHNYLVHKELDPAQLTLQTEEVAAIRWWPLDDFEAALNDPDQAKQFPLRPRYGYDLVVTEIRAALQSRKL